jgi:hypothetical protein
MVCVDQSIASDWLCQTKDCALTLLDMIANAPTHGREQYLGFVEKDLAITHAGPGPGGAQDVMLCREGLKGINHSILVHVALQLVDKNKWS